MAYINGKQVCFSPEVNISGHTDEDIETVRQNGIEQGKQAEYDRFWDSYQNYGNREIYQYAFSYEGWNDETFKPKYDIVPSSDAQKNNYTFYYSQITDLKSILNERNVRLDFSKKKSFSYDFAYSTITRLPTIDFTSVQSFISCTMQNCEQLVEIEKLIVGDSGSLQFSNVFKNCNSLEKVTFEGVLGKNGLNLQWSPLNIESLRNIISCLKDYSADTSGTQWVVTVGSTNLAKLTDDDLDNIEAKGWVFK